MLPALSPLTALERHARYRAHEPAVLGRAGALTFGQLWDRVERSAQALVRAGAEPGQAVAIAMDPGADQLAAILGAMLLGGVAAPLNPRLTPAEADELLVSLRPALVVASTGHALAADGSGSTSTSWGGDRVAARRLRGASHVGDADEAGRPAMILCTGGTTGTPKGALFSHRALWLWTASTAAVNHVRATDTELYVAPFFHGTVVTGLLTTLVVGGSVNIAARFDADEAAALIARGAVTRVLGAATVVDRLVSAARAHDQSASRLRFVQFGMSTSRTGFAAEIGAAMPTTDVITGYGATEFGPVTRTYSWEFDDDGDPVGVGRPVPGADIRILADGTAHDTHGVEGEIIVDAPWRMTAYCSGDLRADADGDELGRHIRSGDLGRFDQHGRLHLTGRLKDTIRTGGETVYPTEVEAVLQRHPEVLACAVYPVSDADWGERVEAAVVSRRSGLPPELLLDHARRHLARFKVPKRIRILEELPMTANNKVDRRSLRRTAEGAQPPPERRGERGAP